MPARAPLASRPRLLLAAVLLATLVAYGGSLAGTRVFDDYHSVFNNEVIRDIENLPRFFTDRDAFSTYRSSHYRPLTLTSYAVTFELFGNSDVAFHAGNLALHLACTAGIFVLILLLFRASKAETAELAAVVGALVFGLHPGASQVVHYISSRSESLAFAGIIGAMCCHAASLAARRPRHIIGWSLGTFACTLVALGAKETGVLALPLLAGVDLAADRSLPAISAKRLARLAIPAAAVLSYMTVLLAPTLLSQPSVTTATVTYGGSDEVWLVQSLRANWEYAEIAAFPRELAMWRALPPSDFPVVEAVLAATALAGGLVVSSVALLRRRRIAGLAGLMSLVPLIPYLLQPLKLVVNENRLYPILAGLALGVAAFVAGPLGRWAAPSPRRKRTATLLGCVLLALCVGRDWKASHTWSSEVRLWKNAIAVSPSSGNLRAGLGIALMGEGDLPAAREQLLVALEQGASQSFVIHDNLGIIAYTLGDKHVALHHFLEAHRLKSDSIEVLKNLGILLHELGEPYRALSFLDRAIALSPDFCEPHLEALRIMRTLDRRDLVPARLRELPDHCADTPAATEIEHWARSVNP